MVFEIRSHSVGEVLKINLKDFNHTRLPAFDLILGVFFVRLVTRYCTRLVLSLK